MKTVIGLFVCVCALILAPAVSAVTVDIASPQEGMTLVPEDTLQLSLTITNDTNEPELAVMVLDVQVGDGEPNDGIPEQPGNIPGISHKPIRVKLAPGESVIKDFELVLPPYKQLPAGEYAFTISVEAYGLRSQTQDSDMIAILMIKP